MNRDELEQLARELLAELKFAAGYIERDLYPELRAGVDETIADAERKLKPEGKR